MARLGEAGLGEDQGGARRGAAWQGGAGPGEAWHGKDQGVARRGVAKIKAREATVDNDGTVERWITASEAATIIGCHLLTVYRFSRTGLLRRKKELGQAKARFSVSDAEALKISRADAIRAKAKQNKNKNHAKVKHRVEAICPRCKKTHMSARVWAGEGKPYFFCPKCQSIEAYSMTSPWQNMAVF